MNCSALLSEHKPQPRLPTLPEETSPLLTSPLNFHSAPQAQCKGHLLRGASPGPQGQKWLRAHHPAQAHTHIPTHLRVLTFTATHTFELLETSDPALTIATAPILSLVLFCSTPFVWSSGRSRLQRQGVYVGARAVVSYFSFVTA